MTEFAPWPKIPRLRRGVVITEKIDGTNACVRIEPFDPDDETQAKYGKFCHVGVDYAILLCQSRKRFITPKDDNAGFAAWAHENAEVLSQGLGFGSHFGEWWGKGIQRGYDQSQRYFSLFNTKRWGDILEDCGSHGELSETEVPEAAELDRIGVRVVPVLGTGPMSSELIDNRLDLLRSSGSWAAPGYDRPEGIVVFHTQAQSMFKVLLENDDIPKGLAS